MDAPIIPTRFLITLIIRVVFTALFSVIATAAAARASYGTFGMQRMLVERASKCLCLLRNMTNPARWPVDIMSKLRRQPLGLVEAEDEKSAIKQAGKRFYCPRAAPRRCSSWFINDNQQKEARFWLPSPARTARTRASLHSDTRSQWLPRSRSLGSELRTNGAEPNHPLEIRTAWQTPTEQKPRS
jgi:hypothetical protein